MSPEERQLLSELFERVRSQANAPRDRDAEALIADSVRAQPYAPYLLAQAVLVQEQTLRAADQKIRALEAQASQLEAEVSQLHAQAQSAPQNSGGFLGGLFGGGAPRPAQPQQAPNPWGAPQQAQQYAQPPQQPGPSPWGAPQQQQPQGGGFLKNAMGAAAGVAGGVLLADSLRGLFGGGHGAGGGLGAGLGSGLGGAGLGGTGLGGAAGGETIVNNFFDTPKKDQDKTSLDSSQDKDQNLSDADYSGDDDFFGGDDDYSSDV
jgi:hypothetical protein